MELSHEFSFWLPAGTSQANEGWACLEGVVLASSSHPSPPPRFSHFKPHPHQVCRNQTLSFRPKDKELSLKTFFFVQGFPQYLVLGDPSDRNSHLSPPFPGSGHTCWGACSHLRAFALAIPSVWDFHLAHLLTSSRSLLECLLSGRSSLSSQGKICLPLSCPPFLLISLVSLGQFCYISQ